MDPVRNPKLVIIGGAVGAYTQNPEDHPVAAVAGMGLGAYVGNEIEIVKSTIKKVKEDTPDVIRTKLDDIYIDVSNLQEDTVRAASKGQIKSVIESVNKHATTIRGFAAHTARKQEGVSIPKAEVKTVEKTMFSTTLAQSFVIGTYEVGSTEEKNLKYGAYLKTTYTAPTTIDADGNVLKVSDNLTDAHNRFSSLINSIVGKRVKQIDKGHKYEKHHSLTMLDIKERTTYGPISVNIITNREVFDKAKESVVASKTDRILEGYKDAVKQNFRAIAGKDLDVVIPDKTLNRLLFDLSPVPRDGSALEPLDVELSKLNISAKDASIIKQAADPDNIHADRSSGIKFYPGFAQLTPQDVSSFPVSNFTKPNNVEIEITSADSRNDRISKIKSVYKNRGFNDIEAERVATNIVDNTNGTIKIIGDDKIRINDPSNKGSSVTFDIPEFKGGNFIIKDGSNIRLGNTYAPFMLMENGTQLPNDLKLAYPMYDSATNTSSIKSATSVNYNMKSARLTAPEMAIAMSKMEGVSLASAARSVKNEERWIQNRNSESVGELVESIPEIYTNVEHQYKINRAGEVIKTSPTHLEYTGILHSANIEHSARGALNPLSGFRHTDDLRVNLAQLNGEKILGLTNYALSKVDASIVQVPERGSNKIARGVLPLVDGKDKLSEALNLLQQGGSDIRNLQGAQLMSMTTVADDYNTSARAFFTGTGVGDGLGIITSKPKSAVPFTVNVGKLEDGIVASKQLRAYIDSHTKNPDVEFSVRPGTVLANVNNGSSSVSIPKYFDSATIKGINIDDGNIVLYGQGITGDVKDGGIVKLYGTKTNAEYHKNFHYFGNFVDRLQADGHIVQDSSGGWRLTDDFRAKARIAATVYSGNNQRGKYSSDIYNANDKKLLEKLFEAVNSGIEDSIPRTQQAAKRDPNFKVRMSKFREKDSTIVKKFEELDPDLKMTEGKIRETQEWFTNLAKGFFKKSGVDISSGVNKFYEDKKKLTGGQSLVLRRDEAPIAHEIGNVYNLFKESMADSKSVKGKEKFSAYVRGIERAQDLLRPYITETHVDANGKQASSLISDIQGREISHIEQKFLDQYNRLESIKANTVHVANNTPTNSKAYKRALKDVSKPKSFANIFSEVLGNIIGASALDAGKESQVVLGSVLNLFGEPERLSDATRRELGDLVLKINNEDVAVHGGFATATQGVKPPVSHSGSATAYALQRYTAVNEAYATGLIDSNQVFDIISSDVQKLSNPLMANESYKTLQVGTVASMQVGNAAITGEKIGVTSSWMGIQQLKSLGFTDEMIKSFSDQNKGAGYQYKGIGAEDKVKGHSMPSMFRDSDGVYDAKYSGQFISGIFSPDREEFVNSFNEHNKGMLTISDDHVHIQLEEVKGTKFGITSLAVPIYDSNRTGTIVHEGKNITHEIERKKQHVLTLMNEYIIGGEAVASGAESATDVGLLEKRYVEAVNDYVEYRKNASKTIVKEASKRELKNGGLLTAIETIGEENELVKIMSKSFNPLTMEGGELPVFTNERTVSLMLGNKNYKLEDAEIEGRKFQGIKRVTVFNDKAGSVQAKGLVGRDPQSGPLNQRAASFYVSDRISNQNLTIAVDRMNLALMSGDLDGDKLITNILHMDDMSNFSEVYQHLQNVEKSQVGIVHDDISVLKMLNKKLADQGAEDISTNIGSREIPVSLQDVSSKTNAVSSNAEGIALAQQRKRDAPAATELQQMIYESINREAKIEEEKILSAGHTPEELKTHLHELNRKRILSLAATNSLQETIIKAVKNQGGSAATAKALDDLMKKRSHVAKFKDVSYKDVGEMLGQHMSDTYVGSAKNATQEEIDAFKRVEDFIVTAVSNHGRDITESPDRMVGSVLGRTNSIDAGIPYVLGESSANFEEGPEIPKGGNTSSSASSSTPPPKSTGKTSAENIPPPKSTGPSSSAPLPEVDINSKMIDADEVFGTFIETIKKNKKPLLLGGLGLGAISMTLGAETPDLKSPALMAPTARTNTTLPPLEENKQYIREYDNWGVDSGSITVAGYRVDGYTDQRFKHGLRQMYMGDKASRHNVTFRDQRY